MKRFFIIVSAITLLGAGCSQNAKLPKAENAANASYIVNGETVKLLNGKSEQKIPDSSSVITTSIFDSNSRADIDGDGTPDTLLILTQNSGGSGTFFYAAAALNTKNGYIGTNSIFLGDRIAPQNINYRDGKIEVNFADRKPNDSFAVRPSVGVTKYLNYIGGQLVEQYQPIGKRLDLKGRYLSKVPSDVFSKTDTEDLDLSNNNLTGAIPAEIRKLKNLKRLDLHNNQMTGLPAELGQLSKLEYLDVSNNQLTGLPYELGNLKNLKTINLSGNNFSETDLNIIKAKLPNTRFITK